MQKVQYAFLNSKHADSYNNSTKHSDLTFRLTRPIVKPYNKILSLKVDTFVFPVSFTQVNSTNNTLYYLGAELTIPEGNYNANTLLTTIQDLIQTEDADTTITYDNTTLKYTFTNASDDFSIDKESTCLTLLGFSEGVDHDSDAHTLTSEFPINLSGSANTLYLDIANLSTDNINTLADQRTTILTSIPVTAQSGGMVYYENTKNARVLLQEDVISELHIRIYGDDLSSLVDFNNQHWNLTLELEFLNT